MSDIIFNEGFLCSTTPSYNGVTQDSVTIDYTNNFFGENGLSPELGDATVNQESSGFCNVNSVTHNASGTFETLYTNMVNYAIANEWYENYTNGSVALPLFSIPFGTTNTRYLTMAVFLSNKNYWTTARTWRIDYSVRIGWSNSPYIGEPGSTFTEIAGIGAGTVIENSPNQGILGYCGYMRVHDLNLELAMADNPLSNIVLVMSASFPFTASQALHPKQVTWSTNNSGRLSTETSVPTRFISLLYTAASYGWPTWNDFSEEVGEPSKEGGNKGGTFDNSSDQIALPASPTIGVSSVGFINVYRSSVNALQGLGAELFPPLAYTPPAAIDPNASTTEALIQGFDAFVTFLANVPSFFDQFMAGTYINYILDCHVIPVDPGAGTSESIKVGNKTMSISAGRIYTDYVDFSCGSISIGEYYTNFADYLTTAKLYLPFVGFVPCRPEWFQNATLSVDYKFNVIDGSFACFVRAGGSHVGAGSSTIVGQYSGNACIHLPITGVTYSNMVSGLVGSAGGMVSGAASGNIASAATSAINASTVHGDIAQSNSYNGSAAFLGCRYPFLLIERPVSSYARNYQHELGIPSNIYARLGSLSGFVRMDNVHLDGIPCTDVERNKIASLLKNGVVV